MKKLFLLVFLLFGVLSVGFVSAGVVWNDDEWDDCYSIDPSCFYTVNGCLEERGCYCGVDCGVVDEPTEPSDDGCVCDCEQNIIYQQSGSGVSKSWVRNYVHDYVEYDFRSSLQDDYVTRDEYNYLTERLRVLNVYFWAVSNGYTEVYEKAGLIFGRDANGKLWRIG